MKNHLSPPAFTVAMPVEWAISHVSYVHCTRLALQAGPVRSTVAAPVLRCTRSFSCARLLMARAIALLLQLVITSTPSRSNHCRAMDSATSGFCWWSAVSTWTDRPGMAAMASSMAIWVQATVVMPEVSR